MLCAYLRLPYEYVPEADSPSDDMSARHTYLALREVRHTTIHLIRDHLRLPAEHPHSWRGHDLDFTGAVFDGGDFSGTVFSSGTVSFSGAELSGGTVSFDRAHFSGGTVDFSGARFSGGTVRFTIAHFSGGRVLFSGANFSGGTVDFKLTRFSGSMVSVVVGPGQGEPSLTDTAGAADRRDHRRCPRLVAAVQVHRTVGGGQEGVESGELIGAADEPRWRREQLARNRASRLGR